MALIQFYLVGGVILIAQGIFTLRTGDIRLLGFLMPPTSNTVMCHRRNRLIGGLFFIGSGLWVAHVPFAASIQGVPLGEWARRFSGPLLVATLCGCLAAFLLAFPSAFLRWMRTHDPEFPTTTRWALWIPRGIGAGAMVAGIQILASILYHTSKG